jgi:predicted acyl esterase
VPITMPDGTVLSANIYRPDRPGRYPVLLFQNPYGSNGAQKNDGGASLPAVGSACTFGRQSGHAQCRAWPAPRLRRAAP